MPVSSNTKFSIDRTRLCELGGLERGKHIRWTKTGVLAGAAPYGELDLIRAVVLDELTEVLKPALARRAWRQIQDDLGLAQGRLDVLAAPQTQSAQLIRNPQQLDQAIPRGQPVILVPLTARIDDARTALSKFRELAGADQPAEIEEPAVERIDAGSGGG